MCSKRLVRLWMWPIAVLSLVLLFSARAEACPDRDEWLAGLNPPLTDDGEPVGVKKKPKKPSEKSAKPASKSKDTPKIRWGQRRNETDEEYDRRYEKVLKRVRKDKKDDPAPGVFTNGKERIYLYTYMGHPFIVRSDISPEFTADTAMYMEMLHRDYGEAYKKFLGEPASVKSKIEVIVFADRATYMRNGGTPGSGGFFMAFAHLQNDRGDSWPARHFRLQQFTDGVTDFAKWPKGTLKHEAAHMELQLRLGMTKFQNVIGLHVEAPRWWNEGHACVFEDWNFDLDVDENLIEVADRGRYAPVIRRLYGTDKWKKFDYVWTIDPQSWHADMTSEQGFLNYAQSWSLAAYMMTSGREGRNHFRSIFDLSRRVGVDRQTTWQGDRMLAWQDAFPEEEQEKLESHWMEWVKKNVTRDKAVPDEEYFLRRMGYDPKVIDKLARFSSEEEAKKNSDWVKKETNRRKKSKLVEK